MLPDASFQQQLANLQQSYAQLGRMIQQPVQPPALQSFDSNPDSVDGLDGAHKYLDQMAANTKKTVWDTSADRFFFLKKDANGKPYRIMIGNFTLEPEPTMEDRYVTRDDFNALEAKINKLLEQKGAISDG